MFSAAILQYTESELGQQLLEEYHTTLLFDHDGEQPSIEELKQAQRSLRNEVPPTLRMCFMQHIGQPELMAKPLKELKPTQPEIYQLVQTIAKWQMLSKWIANIQHPRPQLLVRTLHNQVFKENLDGKSVDLEKPKGKIAPMVALICKKNQWFCLWAVLRYHNVLCTEKLTPFAQQMMHPDWFGNDDERIRIKADNLTDYTCHFTDTTFKLRDNRQYLQYRSLHNKTKWSLHLCRDFLRLCMEMDDRWN